MRKISLISLIFLFCFSSAACADIFMGIPERPQEERQVSTSGAWQKRADEAKKIYLAGDYRSCADELERLLSLNPPRDVKPGMRHLLGLALMQDGRYADARANFAVALSEDTAEKLAQDIELGICDSYFLEGNFDEAYNLYRRFLLAHSLADSAGIANLKLGLCAQKKGRWDEAKYYFQKVQADYPLSMEAKQAIGLLSEPESYFSVQVGSFQDKDNAAALESDLKGRSYEAYMIAPRDKSDSFYRVRVGRFSTKSEAEFTEDKLKKEGFPTKIFP